jgi:hypothetical protein
MPMVMDVDGSQHDMIVQALDETCACASIAMVVRKMKSQLLDESSARNELNRLEGSPRRGGNVTWRNTGVDPDVIGSALSKWVNSAKTWDAGTINISNYLKTHCKRSRPGIAIVAWNGGGGHAVVVLGLNNAGTNLMILDPGVSPAAVTYEPQGNLPTYNAPYGNVGTFFAVVTTD